MKKKWKYVTNNKMRDFGSTDYNKRVVSVNKKMHKTAKKEKTHSGLSKKETTLINTEVHELLHRRHPKMTERDVRKKTLRVVERMSRARKQAVYKKFA